MSPPPSRNAPCPCGSGKRYKECHGAIASRRPTVAEDEDFAAQAQSALRAGRFREALAWLQRALDVEPESAELRRECARIAWMMGSRIGLWLFDE
jgi:hypothetical protein